MEIGKSPGPDGFTSAFFQKFWPELKSTVMACTREFFKGNPLVSTVNHTWLTLVPKKVTAASLADYRPISCVNTIYKILSKLQASRLMEIADLLSHQIKLHS